MTEILIRINDTDAQQLLGQATTQLSNIRPVLAGVANILLQSVEFAFDQQRDPSSHQPWQALAPATQAYRAKHRRSRGKILQFNGALIASIMQDYGDNFVRVGTISPYAPIHQFGGMAGRNRKTYIPARPFLGLGQHDKADIIKEVESYISRTT
jgi:phage virion morphogenesis protein